jgi:hypothetical protein
MRTNSICIYVGKRGTGKTDFVKNLIDLFPQPKTLVVDIFDNPVWHNMATHDHPEWINRLIPAIPLEMLPKHSTGLYRVFFHDIELLENAIDLYVRNTALIVEDCSRWFNARLTKTQKRYLLNCKQTNCDVHLFFHTLSAIPPELIKYADYLTIFKTGERFYDPKKYYLPEFDFAFNKVIASPDRFINQTIKLQ